MASSDSLKEIYEQRRYDNSLLRQEHIRQAYKLCPELHETDRRIKQLTLALKRRQILKQRDEQEAATLTKLNRLKERKQQLLLTCHIPADYDQPVYTCPDCEDLGTVNGEACHCYRQLKADLLFSQSPIRRQMEKENFSTFQFSLFSDTIPEGHTCSPKENIRKVRQSLEDFIRHFPSGANLLFQGSTGVGKTFLTNCIAAELLHAGHTVAYLTAVQFFELLADHEFHREQTARAQERYQYIEHAELLIIDDLGTEMNNTFVETALFDCLNKRYMRELSTIISTNLEMRQLEHKYSKRISSRLMEHYHIFPLFGPDIRLQKRK